MITVINGGDSLAEAVQAELLDTWSHTRFINLNETEVQAVKITAGRRRYVVILCHNELFHSSDAVIAGDCFWGRKCLCFLMCQMSKKAKDAMEGSTARLKKTKKRKKEVYRGLFSKEICFRKMGFIVKFSAIFENFTFFNIFMIKSIIMEKYNGKYRKTGQMGS